MDRVLLTPAAVALCSASSLSLTESISLAGQMVTATHTAQTAPQSLTTVSVVDCEDIGCSQARGVPELLHQVPDMSLASNDGFGKGITLFLRDTESDHVLVLIDDIEVSPTGISLTVSRDLPVELIGRIEMVRESRSSLYGSETVGGVVQIFTRHDDDQGAKPLFSTGYDIRQTPEGSAGVGGDADDGRHSLGVSSFDAAGANTKHAGTAGYESDRDDYRNLSDNPRGGYRLDSGLELGGTLLRTKSYDGYG